MQNQCIIKELSITYIKKMPAIQKYYILCLLTVETITVVNVNRIVAGSALPVFNKRRNFDVAQLWQF